MIEIFWKYDLFRRIMQKKWCKQELKKKKISQIKRHQKAALGEILYELKKKKFQKELKRDQKPRQTNSS